MGHDVRLFEDGIKEKTMKRTTLLAVLIFGLAGAGAVLSLAGKQAGPDIPDGVLAVFKKHCVRCHTGPKPPKGLSLIPSRIAAAIGSPSAEVPEAKLIDPAVPEASYLLKKVRREGGFTGKPMPPGKALTAEEIQTVTTWIEGLK
jgi:mono/diheme cytochrome c family protein